MTDALPNRPPYFTSTPVTEACVNIVYDDTATATDPDDDDMTFSVDVGPTGLSIDEDTGEIFWVPTADQVEQVFDVTLRVTDEHGAYAAQPYKVYVMPQPGNHPPIIISEPSEYFETADPPRSDQGEVSPTSINLHLEDGQTESRTVYVTPSASGIYADVFLNFDDTGSCTYFAPKVTREFPLIINALLNDPELADVNFAFGVGRFEEYSSFAGEYDVGRPFILNSPMIAASDPEFMDAIDGALPIVIAASDVGTAYQPDVPEIDPILGVRDENGDPVEVDLARFQAEDTSRPSTFQGRGAKIQETVDALVDLGALVIGLGAATGPPGEGWGINPALDPRQDLEALAELTGAVNGSDDTIPSGIAGDPIEPGDQFYFFAGTVGWASENDPVAGGDHFCYRNVNYDPADPSVILNVLDNDWDIDGDRLKITRITQAPSQGTVEISLHRDYLIYTPPAGGFVDTSFKYEISDGHFQDEGTVAIDETPYGSYGYGQTGSGNDYLCYRNVNRFDPVHVYLMNNDWDSNGDELRITGVSQPSQGGTAAISSAGDYVIFTPPSGGFVEETFTYTVSDGDEGQDTATVTLDDGMYGGYAGPTALSGFGAGIVEAIKSSLTRVKFNVECVASDDTVLFQSTPDVQRGVSPLEQVSFQTQFTGDGFRHSFDVLFVREGTNVILGSIPVTIDDDYRYDVDAIDPDDDPVTYHLDTEISPAEATIDEQSGKIRWVPPEPGQYPFRVYARDNRGGEDFQDFTVTVSAGAPNQAPEITSVARTDAAVGRPYVYQVEAEDGDGDRLAHYLQPYQQETVPEGMSIDRVTGRLTWTPISADAASVTVRVLDGRGKEDTEDIVFDVAAWLPNSDPQITTIPDTGAVVGQELSLPVAVSDAESDPIALDLPLKPIGMSIDPLDGRIVWTPTADQLGKHDVLVRARDGQGGVGLEWFAVNVSATNVAPQITSTPPAGPAVVGRTYEYRVEAQDANGNAITLTLDAASTTRGIQITTDATTKVTYLRWTPLPGDIGGLYGITITASDGTLDDTQSFSLSAVAAPANGAPTFDTTALPSPTGVGLSYATQVKATDPDGDVLKYFLDAGPEGMTIDLTSGVLSWTPDADDLGTHDVIVSVSDGRGSRVAEDFSLTVEENPLNHAPTIGTTSLPGPTAVGVAYEAPIAASDSDGDRLTYSLDQTSRDRGMSIDQSGLLQWPTTGAVGTYPVTVTVDDGRGGSVSSQNLSVTVATSPVNHPPQVGTAPIPSPTGVGILYQAQIVATDPDGDPLSFSLDPTSESKGMTMVGDLLTWTPTAAQKGSHSITVTVSDGRGGSEQKACSLEVVDGVNVPPEITSTPRLRVRAGQKYLYAAEAFDANGDGLTFTLEESPTGATYPMTIHPVTHVISWQTTAAEAGNTYPVRVRVSDGLAYAVQSFDVEVITAAANADPEIVSTPPLDALLGELYQHRLEADDPDGDMLQWTLVKGPAGISLHPYSGVLAWVPTKDQIKPQDVVVKVADPYGGSDTQSFTIIPRAVNLGPSITSVPPTSVVVDQLYVYAIRAVDPDDDAISFSLTESPAHDEVTHADAMTINTTTGEITWLPSQAQLEANGGVHYVTVVATANGLSAGQRYRVVVRAASSTGTRGPSRTTRPTQAAAAPTRTAPSTESAVR